MKTYKTQAEVEKDVVNGVLVVDESVTFEFNLSMFIFLKIAGGITARDINAGGITARDINAGDINAGNITARDITARDINAEDINAGNILYHAFCCVYKSIFCLSIKATRNKAHEPICLDGELKIKEKK